MKLAIIALSFLALPLTAFCSMESIYVEQNGTCTKLTCPPGVKVVVDVTKEDTGYTLSPSGEQVNLMDLRGIEFHVDRNDDKCEQCSIVVTDSGTPYSIQRMFLKKSG